MAEPRVIVIGAGIGGLTTAALLAKRGFEIVVLEAQTYAGGCAGTFYHQGYRFDAGATVAGGFQPGGPHALAAEKLGLKWPIRQHDPAWVVHFPDHQVMLSQDNKDVLKHFPQSARFWAQQNKIANLAWQLSAQGLPWPPRSLQEFTQLAKVGLLNFPIDLQLLPFAFSSVSGWLTQHKLEKDRAFVRFIDGQLLIAAQTTSRYTNALYGATALDLARQGVYHVEGGIGGLAQTLVKKLEELGGQVLYRHRVERIQIKDGRVSGVYISRSRHSQHSVFMPCDFVIGNLTPWSADMLLAENSPRSLRQEVSRRRASWGAFVVHLGIEANKLPMGLEDHHQIISEMEGELGEGRSIFISISPEWDSSRAPTEQRAVTITTHTNTGLWWQLIAQSEQAYTDRKAEYTEKIINTIERFIPGFSSSIRLTLRGTPVTYQFYTGRYQGMVGGFPQTSLFKMRGPRTGIRNMRLVGDSIFPGQSTAGVTLGALRVAEDVLHNLPLGSAQRLFSKAKVKS